MTLQTLSDAGACPAEAAAAHPRNRSVSHHLPTSGADPLEGLRAARAADRAFEHHYLYRAQHLHALVEALHVQILEVRTERSPHNTILEGRLSQARGRAGCSVGQIPSDDPPQGGVGARDLKMIDVATRALQREIDEARLTLARLRGAQFP